MCSVHNDEERLPHWKCDTRPNIEVAIYSKRRKAHRDRRENILRALFVRIFVILILFIVLEERTGRTNGCVRVSERASSRIRQTETKKTQQKRRIFFCINPPKRENNILQALII